VTQSIRTFLPALALGLLLGHSARAAELPVSARDAGWSGEPISVELKDAQMTDLMRLIAHVSGLNLVVDPAVSGKTITLTLHDVPWDQALDLITRTHGLSAVRDGNILRVAPTTKLATEAQQEAQLREARDQAGSLQTYVYPLSWGNASAVETILRRMLTPRGTIMVDKRTNTLIVQDIRPPDPSFTVIGPQADAGRFDGVPPPPQVRVRIHQLDARGGEGPLLASGALTSIAGNSAELGGVTLSTVRDGEKLVLTVRGAGRGAWLPEGEAGRLSVTARDGAPRLVIVDPV
jgi:hypothetical protein